MKGVLVGLAISVAFWLVAYLVYASVTNDKPVRDKTPTYRQYPAVPKVRVGPEEIALMRKFCSISDPGVAGCVEFSIAKYRTICAEGAKTCSLLRREIRKYIASGGKRTP